MSLNESPNLEQSALRLPTLSMTPSADKLREALFLATNNVQNVIQLPWKAPNSPVNYMVKVSCQPNAQEPAWALHVGSETEDSILWSYNTADCQMISDLIAAEVNRAAYAAASAQPAPMPVPPQAPLMPAPQMVSPSSPPPHLSQSVQPQTQPQPQKQPAAQPKPTSYDWGTGQSATQQGQDWNWSTPSISNNDANWSTSGHARLPLPAEPIVPINDPQAFSQSWGTPSPSISSPDTGLQRNTKPPGAVQPGIKPAESSIFLSGPLAQSSRDAASQTLGLPQMQPVDSLSAPAPEVSPAALAAPAENQSLPIGGFAHAVPVAEDAAPQAPVTGVADGDSPGVATLDSVPVMQDSLQAPDGNPIDATRPLPVVPSSRAYTSTLSATLPLNEQETLSSDEQSLTAPQVDVADLPRVQEVPPEFAPAAEPDKKQTNRRKGRGSKLNLPAVEAPGEPADIGDQEAVAESSMTPEMPLTPVGVYDAPNVVPVQAEIPQPFAPAPFDPVMLFEAEPLPTPTPAPVSNVEPGFVPAVPQAVPLPVPPATVVAPLTIDLSSIPPLPAVAEFAPVGVSLTAPPVPPLFAVEFDAVEAPGPEVAPQAAPQEEQDPTVPMSVATGEDIANARALHEPPIPIADLSPEASPPEFVSAAPSETPAEAHVEAPKRVLPSPAPFNREAVDDIFKHLTNQETGFITNSAFMFFIVREFSRYQKAQTPITLIGFELALRAPDGAMYPVHLAALRECGRRFFSVMRPLDWLAHYSDDEYALLLPHTSIRESILLVKDLYTVLNQGPLLVGMEDAQVVMHCGIASIPEDCQHPGILIAAAYEAKNEAKKSNLAVQLFRDMPA